MKPTLFRTTLSYSLILFFAVISSCSHPEVVPDFYHNDNLWVGTEINFSSNGENNWKWDFGDQSTARGISVVHVYAAKGKYSVTLRDPETDLSTTKELTITNGTERVAGNRLWDGHIGGTTVTGHSMELLVTNDTIRCQPNPVSFMDRYVYVQAYPDHISYHYPNPFHDGAVINYYFQNDSITYSASGQSVDVFLHTQ